MGCSRMRHGEAQRELQSCYQDSGRSGRSLRASKGQRHGATTLIWSGWKCPVGSGITRHRYADFAPGRTGRGLMREVLGYQHPSVMAYADRAGHAMTKRSKRVWAKEDLGDREVSYGEGDPGRVRWLRRSAGHDQSLVGYPSSGYRFSDSGTLSSRENALRL